MAVQSGIHRRLSTLHPQFVTHVVGHRPLDRSCSYLPILHLLIGTLLQVVVLAYLLFQVTLLAFLRASRTAVLAIVLSQLSSIVGLARISMRGQCNL